MELFYLSRMFKREWYCQLGSARLVRQLSKGRRLLQTQVVGNSTAMYLCHRVEKNVSAVFSFPAVLLYKWQPEKIMNSKRVRNQCKRDICVLTARQEQLIQRCSSAKPLAPLAAQLPGKAWRGRWAFVCDTVASPWSVAAEHTSAPRWVPYPCLLCAGAHFAKENKRSEFSQHC